MTVFIVDPSKKDSADDWQLPQLPKTFDEAWQAASNLGKSATAMITGKECDKPAEEEVGIIEMETSPDTEIPMPAEEVCICPPGVCQQQ